MCGEKTIDYCLSLSLSIPLSPSLSLITLSKVAEGECRAAPRQLTKAARGSLRNPAAAAGLAPGPSAPLSLTPLAPTLLQAPRFPTEVTAQDGRRAAHPQVMPGARQESRLHQVTPGNV